MLHTYTNVSVAQIPRRRISGAKSACIYHYDRCWQIAFSRSWTKLHSHLKCKRMLVSLCLCQMVYYHTFWFWNVWWKKMVYHWNLTCILFLMKGNTHFFMFKHHWCYQLYELLTYLLCSFKIFSANIQDHFISLQTEYELHEAGSFNYFESCEA